MDARWFDALTRFLEVRGSRRAALATTVSAGLLGNQLAAAASKNKNRNKQKQRRRRRQRTNAAHCFGAKTCQFSGAGREFDDCDFAGTSTFVGEECGGCSLRHADFTDAGLVGAQLAGASLRNAGLGRTDLRNADLRGASLRDACLVGANLLGARTDGADFRGATFCRTMLSDGSIDDSDCDKGTPCCETCIPLGGACGNGVNGACCGNVACEDGVCGGPTPGAAECDSMRHCPICQICVQGVCEALPNSEYDCFLNPLGPGGCTTMAGIGVCHNGSCSCGLGGNPGGGGACVCPDSQCGSGRCCVVTQVCEDGSATDSCESCPAA